MQLFQEFMMATDMTASGSPEEKLRWAFKMYDKDGSGQSLATIIQKQKRASFEFVFVCPKYCCCLQ